MAHIVQVDDENPHDARRKVDGRRRLALNPTERQILKDRDLISRALGVFTKDTLTIQEAADKIGVDERFLINAYLGEDHPEWREAVLQRIVDMYLSLDEAYTKRDIERSLGLSGPQIRILLESPDFERIYNSSFIELRRHPAIRATRAKIFDELLPRAYQYLHDILEDGNAPATARLKAALTVLDRSGIQGFDLGVNERNEIAGFLSERNIDVTQININIPVPPEFLEASQETMIDAEVVEIDGDDPGE